MPQPPKTHDPHSARGPHALQNLPRVELEIVRGTAHQRTRRVSGPAFLIGRAHDNDLVLGDSQFPEAHSYILLGPQGVTIKYMGSGPELTVNGRVVGSSALCDGDTIGTGPYEFLVRVSPSPYRGRPFDDVTSDAADLRVADNIEDSADNGDPVAQASAAGGEIAVLSLRGRELKPVAEVTLKLPYWLRPPLPRVTPSGVAAYVAPQHFTADARILAPSLNDHSRAAPKRAV